ncbi:MAG: hypothetical protein ACXU8U_07740 [Asticcacaulis sp.]
MLGLFSRPIAFRVQEGQGRRLYVELPGIVPGSERRVLVALKRMGRVRVKSRSNDFGHYRIDFAAMLESYSLDCSDAGTFIHGESGGDELDQLIAFMRKSRRFNEIVLHPAKARYA